MATLRLRRFRMAATIPALAWSMAAATLCASVDSVAATARRLEAPASVRIIDFSQRLDANNLGLVVSNLGSFAYGYESSVPGLEFPLGSNHFVLFAGGLWLGAGRPEGPRLAVAEYSMEFGPGVILPGGLPDIHDRADDIVYKLQRQYPDADTRDMALADYVAGAVPRGAPRVTVLEDGTLGILGDQMLWTVYNDADATQHTNFAGSTAPLGIEVRQTTFALNAPGPLGNTALLRFQLLNKGALDLDSLYVALWLDPDLGGATDDLVGCDVAAGLGYCYNATNNDLVYGAQPPAVGIDLVQGPQAHANGPRLGPTSFVRYINGTDPNTPAKTYACMQGLTSDGSPMIDPTTSGVTRFVFPGDPVTQTGWVDAGPTDQRMMLSSGPFHLAPGDSTDLLAAIVVGQGSDRLSSITALRFNDAAVKAQYGSLPSLAVGPATPQGAALAVSLGPNPARGQCTVAFRLEQSAPVVLEVFDVHGRRAAREDLSGLAAGPHAMALDLRGEPDGLYFVRLTQGLRSGSARMAVVH